MNKKIKRGALEKVVRLLTLISFFHLSGLNNGFTQVTFTAGQISGFDFAPVAIARALQIANPFFWKQFVMDGEWKELAANSSRALELTSHRTVTRMLVEGNLFQMWLVETMNRSMGKVSFTSSKSLCSAVLLVREFGTIQENGAKHSLGKFQNGHKRVLYDKIAAHLAQLKEQFWDKLTVEHKKFYSSLDPLSTVQIKGVVFERRWEGVNPLKFEGIGYLRSESAGNDWKILSFRESEKNANIPRSYRDVSFLGKGL